MPQGQTHLNGRGMGLSAALAPRTIGFNFSTDVFNTRAKNARAPIISGCVLFSAVTADDREVVQGCQRGKEGPIALRKGVRQISLIKCWIRTNRLYETQASRF